MTSITPETMEQMLAKAMDPIHASISNLTCKVDDFQTSLLAVKATAETAQTAAANSLALAQNNEQRIIHLESTIIAQQGQYKTLHEYALKIETHSRKVNLKWEEIPEERGESCFDKITKIVTDIMELTTDNIIIVSAHRLGQFNNNKTRPIITKFAHVGQRDSVWAKRLKLKGTRIWLSEDYPPELERRRRMLWPFLRAARNMSTEDKPVTAFLRIDKLIINKQPSSLDQLQDIPAPIRLLTHCKKHQN